MEKKNFIKRIKEKINEFFEEDENKEDEEEINLKTLVIIFLIGFAIITSIYYIYTNKSSEFMKSGLDETEGMEQDDNKEIQEITNYFENYFVGEKGLENSDFSDGMNYWSTSDSGKLYKDSISKRMLNKEDYHSSPQSLQVDCFQPPCRIYYDTKSSSIVLNDPYNTKSGIWGGVKPGTKFKIMYWYKGRVHTFYFMGLDKNGNFKNLETIEGKSSTEWVKNEFITVIPKDKIAIGIEITINTEGILLLDDIQLEKVE